MKNCITILTPIHAEYKTKNNEIYLINIKKKSCTCRWHTIHAYSIQKGFHKPCHHIKELLEAIKI